MAATAERRGIRASARRVIGHASTLAQLHRSLAQAELQRKAQAAGAGAGLFVAAVFVGFFALALGIATAAAALMIVLDAWLALLILFAAFQLLAVVLVLVGVRLVKKATPLAPTQAREELELTKRMLRDRGA
jgi:hypothetical protein